MREYGTFVTDQEQEAFEAIGQPTYARTLYARTPEEFEREKLVWVRSREYWMRQFPDFGFDGTKLNTPGSVVFVPPTRRARRRLADPALVILAILVAFVLVIVLAIALGGRDQQGDNPKPGAVSGNSAYLATAGPCVPAVLDSGVSTCIGAARVFNIRSFTVNPGRCYQLDGGTRMVSRGTLPAFYYMPPGSHWLRSCP